MAPGAEALHARATMSCVIDVRRAREDRSDEEDRDAGQIHPPAAVQIGQPAPDRHRGGGRQQVGREDPAVVRQPAERGDHGRHRRADDGRFERAEAHAEQEAGGNGAAPSEADPRRRVPRPSSQRIPSRRSHSRRSRHK